MICKIKVFSFIVRVDLVVVVVACSVLAGTEGMVCHFSPTVGPSTVLQSGLAVASRKGKYRLL
jgi:hypothetical protein